MVKHCAHLCRIHHTHSTARHLKRCLRHRLARHDDFYILGGRNLLQFHSEIEILCFTCLVRYRKREILPRIGEHIHHLRRQYRICRGYIDAKFCCAGCHEAQHCKQRGEYISCRFHFFSLALRLISRRVNVYT